MERLARLHMLWLEAAGGKQQGAIADAAMDVALLLLPIWVAVLFGLVLGWSWRPRWPPLLLLALRSRARLAWSFPPGFGARRLWLAATAAAAAPALREACARLAAWLRARRHAARSDALDRALQPPPSIVSREEETADDRDVAVGNADLENLCRLLEELDGGPEWSLLMHKEAAGMRYTAWRRDPEVGPTQYRSCTVVANCSPELMRDFFWDDDFRMTSRWDDMLVHSKVLEECPHRGVQVVQWVRKFPFFCKDREYVIGRRIWSFNNTYYCITKGVTHPHAPLKEKPRRVPVFYSSWRIRAVDDGACEVALFHHEDMGIQKDLAKLGIRQGMWSAVKKIEPGVRQYQNLRQERPRELSRSASMANIHTPISPMEPSLTRVWRSVSDLRQPDVDRTAAGCGDGRTEWVDQNERERGRGGEGAEGEDRGHGGIEEREERSLQKKRNRLGMRWMVVGSLFAVACGVNTGLVWKVLLAGTAQKLVERHLRKSSRS